MTGDNKDIFADIGSREYLRNEFSRMHLSLTNDEVIQENIRHQDIIDARNDKIADTGL